VLAEGGLPFLFVETAVDIVLPPYATVILVGLNSPETVTTNIPSVPAVKVGWPMVLAVLSPLQPLGPKLPVTLMAA
jgi:hypothetical protein